MFYNTKLSSFWKICHFNVKLSPQRSDGEKKVDGATLLQKERINTNKSQKGGSFQQRKRKVILQQNYVAF